MQTVYRIANTDEAREALPHLDPLIATLLYNRGIRGAIEAREFLTPDYDKHIHDPFLMKDMDKVVKRILKAIKNDEKIVIFGDYDCDGIPASVALHDALKKIGYNNFINYIPHRHDEGFGLNLEAIELFAREKADLLITIDCGITDVEEVERANELGIEVIITDHHLVGEKLPPAYAILNPKQEGCTYPEKMLCGAGVIYKLIQALYRSWKPSEGKGLAVGAEKWYLDMIGIATLSDMVPLVGENRALAHFGLRVLRKSPRLGLQKLLQAVKVAQPTLSEEDVGFSIAPRLNVASRMSEPVKAFELLSTVDHTRADHLVRELEGYNDERKGLVASMVKDIKKRLAENPLLLESPVLVFGHTHWRPAVAGLASNTIMREVKRPVFVWGRDGGDQPTDGLIKGSCRSNGSVNLVELMREVPAGLFNDFGGHALSGGFSIMTERIHEVQEALNQAYGRIAKAEVNEEVLIDMRLTLDQVKKSVWQKIAQCGPYGTGNPKPLFIFEGVSVKQMKTFGKKGEHVELLLIDESGATIKAIQFFSADDPKFQKLEQGSTINLLAHMEESLFKYYPEYRLRIVDLV